MTDNVWIRWKNAYIHEESDKNIREKKNETAKITPKIMKILIMMIIDKSQRRGMSLS